MGESLKLVRKPDAGKPPVRFDERDVETEVTRLTAPHPDSTRDLWSQASSPDVEGVRLAARMGVDLRQRVSTFHADAAGRDASALRQARTPDATLAAKGATRGEKRRLKP